MSALLQARDRLELPSRQANGAELLAAGFVELAVDGNAGIRALSRAVARLVLSRVQGATRVGGLPSDPIDRLMVAITLRHRAAL